MKYEKFTQSGCKDIGIRKSELVAKTQFLYQFTIFGTRSKKKVLGFKKRNNLEYITQMLVFGWVRNKQGRTGLGTSNEKQKND